MTSLDRTFRKSLSASLLWLGLSLISLPALADSHTPEANTAVQASGVVNINSATAEELDRLPGVGPSRAQAILELRAKLKRFSSIDDLMRVKGIGRASLRKLRPMLVLEGQTTLAAPAHAARPARAPKAAE